MTNLWDELKLVITLFLGFMTNKVIVSLFVVALVINIILYFVGG
jgi:hypothetical protein